MISFYKAINERYGMHFENTNLKNLGQTFSQYCYQKEALLSYLRITTKIQHSKTSNLTDFETSITYHDHDKPK